MPGLALPTALVMTRPIPCVLLSAILVVAVACWGDSHAVTVENRTKDVVVVFEDGSPIELLHPGVTQEFVVTEFVGAREFEIQAFSDRRVLAQRAFTWDELDAEDGFDIVVTE